MPLHKVTSLLLMTYTWQLNRAATMHLIPLTINFGYNKVIKRWIKPTTAHKPNHEFWCVKWPF